MWNGSLRQTTFVSSCLEDVPFDIGVLLTGDGCGVPYRVSQRLNTKGGDFVCVLGAGPVGLGNTIVQSFLGAEVIVIDINDYRLSLAKEAGAAHTINSKNTDPLEAITEITHGMLVDKCNRGSWTVRRRLS